MQYTGVCRNMNKEKYLTGDCLEKRERGCVSIFELYVRGREKEKWKKRICKKKRHQI